MNRIDLGRPWPPIPNRVNRVQGKCFGMLLGSRFDTEIFRPRVPGSFASICVTDGGTPSVSTDGQPFHQKHRNSLRDVYALISREMQKCHGPLKKRPSQKHQTETSQAKGFHLVANPYPKHLFLLMCFGCAKRVYRRRND